MPGIPQRTPYPGPIIFCVRIVGRSSGGGIRGLGRPRSSSLRAGDAWGIDPVHCAGGTGTSPHSRSMGVNFGALDAGSRQGFRCLVGDVATHVAIFLFVSQILWFFHPNHLVLSRIINLLFVTNYHLF